MSSNTRDVNGGVRVRFAAGTRASDILQQMRCHYAYVRAHGWSNHPDCSFDVRGVAFRRTADPQAIEIIGQNRSATTRIRKSMHAGALGVVATGEK